MTATAHLLLITADDARRGAWEAALSGRCRIVPPTDGAAVKLVDVIVTDAPLSATAAVVGESRLARGDVGLIAVGTGNPADVSLPADHSPRELRLACLLLVEIVRLRRQQASFRRKERSLLQQALSDPLTGLPNRRAWELHLSDRQGRPELGGNACLALFDIDHFKPLNDAHGHLAGDACLKGVAARLAAAVRRGDFMARLGGDEFAALLEGVDESGAEEVVERIRQAAGGGLGTCGPVTLSAGWFVLSGVAADADSVLRRADAALGVAKQSGRNTSRAG